MTTYQDNIDKDISQFGVEAYAEALAKHDKAHFILYLMLESWHGADTAYEMIGAIERCRQWQTQ